MSLEIKPADVPVAMLVGCAVSEYETSLQSLEMTGRELRTIRALIEWAVDPVPPLPAVPDTDAVAAFAADIDRSQPPQRLALRGALALVEVLPLRWLDDGLLAPLGDALAALAQLAYYGDLTVMRALGYDPERVTERGRAVRLAEARW